MATFQRKEVKYKITTFQRDQLLRCINEKIVSDQHAKYQICNLYLDTDNHRLIRNSIDKPRYKEKIRIRSYGVISNEDKIFLELKKKLNGVVYKRRVKMRYDEAIAYLKGDANRSEQISNEIDYFLSYYKQIEPKYFIAYDRVAYQGKEDSSLRITFDENITYRTTQLDLTCDSGGSCILDKDWVLLEIKATNAMPIWLVKALSECKIYKQSFSKYGQAYLLENDLKMEE